MELSIQKKIGIVFISFVALVVAVGLVIQIRSDKKTAAPEITPSLGATESVSGEETFDSNTEFAPVRERSGKEVSTLLSEIESAADGDATALDEEVADETQSVREGQLVIQEMAQSYDETSY